MLTSNYKSFLIVVKKVSTHFIMDRFSFALLP